MNCGFLLILICLPFFSFAQPDEFTLDLKESLKSKPKPWLNLHNSFAFVSGSPVQSRTIKAGLSFDKNLKLGIGYSWLSSDYKITNDKGKQGSLKLNYLSGILEYKFHRAGNWHFVIPVQLGMGSSYLKSSEEKKPMDKGLIFLYEPSMIAEYHFLQYFSVAAGVGLRIALINNSNIDRQLTSPLFLVRFQVDFNKIVEELN